MNELSTMEVLQGFAHLIDDESIMNILEDPLTRLIARYLITL